MQNSYSGICSYTGKNQTIIFEKLNADTLKNNTNLLSRYDCDNKFCDNNNCPLYNAFIKANS